jgi:hypothetical protein
MGYMHINNLYKDQKVLLFKEVYALEKVHGTSAHIAYTKHSTYDEIRFFSGGENHQRFCALFDESDLREKFRALGHEKVTLFGEAYGGKQQGMSATYGKDLCFVVFDVKIGNTWLNVKNAENVAQKMGLEFVPYEKVPAKIDALNAERDRPSRVAIRRGVQEPKTSEGIIIRPLEEFFTSSGERCIAKHKTAQFSERKSKADTVADPAKLKILTDAQEVADEWVTPMRLEHVLDKLPSATGMESVPQVIAAMTEDVLREASGEIVVNKETRRAIGKATVLLFKKQLQQKLSRL